ncbi:hypothetical protein CEXT_298931 [Caerostris extrusa]|uniref:Uncharacterized protein n=1 Tax=Caerostris extrusa TaxID=172846 RepID=A0AAV4PI43_CAEEX|nr:hypothetical protein CEXT_298931 [Caerostris extrusa]
MTRHYFIRAQSRATLNISSYINKSSLSTPDNIHFSHPYPYLIKSAVQGLRNQFNHIVAYLPTTRNLSLPGTDSLEMQTDRKMKYQRKAKQIWLIPQVPVLTKLPAHLRGAFEMYLPSKIYNERPVSISSKRTLWSS